MYPYAACYSPVAPRRAPTGETEKESIMAEFKPVRLTHPNESKAEEFGDVVATTAVDLSNYLYRDGYVKSADQSNLDGEDDQVESGTAPAEGAPNAAPKEETPAEKRNRERQEREAAKSAEGKATDSNGDVVATS